MSLRSLVCVWLVLSLGVQFGLAGDIVKVGDSKDDVLLALGKSKGSYRLGSQEVVVYEQGEITFEKGKVVKVELMTDAELARKQEAARQRSSAAQAAASAAAANAATLADAERQKKIAEAQKSLKENQDASAALAGFMDARDAVFGQGNAFYIWPQNLDPVPATTSQGVCSPVGEMSFYTAALVQTNPAVAAKHVRIKVSVPTREGEAAYQVWDINTGVGDSFVIAPYLPGLADLNYTYKPDPSSSCIRTQCLKIVGEYLPAGYHAKGQTVISMIGEALDSKPTSNILTLPLTNAPAALK